MKAILRKNLALVFTVLCFSAVNAEPDTKSNNVRELVEKVAAVASVPTSLATQFAFENKRTASLVKAIDDVLVIVHCGMSVYNKSINDARDLSYYKVLDAAYRMRDLFKQVRVISNGSQMTEDVKQPLLIKVHNLALSAIQSGARVYGSLYKQEDTEEQRKIRYWIDAVAFLANRLSDITSSTATEEEYEYQAAGVVAGLVLLLAYAPERSGFEAVAEGAKDIAKDLADKAHGALKVGARGVRRGFGRGMRALREILD